MERAPVERTDTRRPLARRAAVIAGVVALVVVAVLVAWKALPALLLIFVAVLIALLLTGMAGGLSRRTGLGLSLIGVPFAGGRAVLASPLVVALTVLVQTLYVQDALGDDLRVLGEKEEEWKRRQGGRA